MKNEGSVSGVREQRLDKWLWHARFVKSRNLAAKHIQDGTVRINRMRIHKPSACVKCGDVLTLALHMRVRVVEVLGFSASRGPASDAEKLYRELLPFQGDGMAESNGNNSVISSLVDRDPATS